MSGRGGQASALLLLALAPLGALACVGLAALAVRVHVERAQRHAEAHALALAIGARPPQVEGAAIGVEHRADGAIVVRLRPDRVRIRLPGVEGGVAIAPDAVAVARPAPRADGGPGAVLVD